MKTYSYFGYSVNEALHTSDKEKLTLLQCLENIEQEISNNIDKHSEELAVSNLGLFLNYCTRFFERQFLTRKKFNNHILERFEELLEGYFSANKAEELGLPSVKYFAEQVNLSPNYFSDYLKKKSASETR